MKLLIKPMWRGVFQMYLIDFKQKEERVKKYPPTLRHFAKELIVFNGFFLFIIPFSSRLRHRRKRTKRPANRRQRIAPSALVGRSSIIDRSCSSGVNEILPNYKCGIRSSCCDAKTPSRLYLLSPKRKTVFNRLFITLKIPEKQIC